MDKDVQQLDSGVSPEWLRHEQEQAHFNELYLLAPCGYFVVGFDGTGHASLAYLKRYDIDLVKIDPSLAQTLDGEGGELALYEAIVAMAHKPGLKVVAEGALIRGHPVPTRGLALRRPITCSGNSARRHLPA